jgi:competence protein ComEC
MVSVRSIAQWALGAFVVLFALTALAAIELSVLSILRGVVAATLFLAAAALIVPRTRHALLGRTDRPVSSGVLAVLVVTAVLTGMVVTPLDGPDDPEPDTAGDGLKGTGADDAEGEDDGESGEPRDGESATDDNGETDGADSGEQRSDDEPDGTADDDGTTSDDRTASDGTADDLEDEPTDDSGDEPADNSEDEPADVDGDLEIHHIDVGQADSTLLVTPDGETILIDTGDWRQDGSDVIAYLDSEGIDRIDHLVATHAHADHIGGHAAVIEHFETERDGIGAAYDSGVTHTSATYESYLDAIDEYAVDLFTVEEGDELPVDGVGATVLNPPAGESGTDLHYNSVTIAFEFGEFGYLTTGDAENRAEERLVDDWRDRLDADAYHAGHHGSSTSSTAPFMDAVDPEIAIISSGYDNQYGHPHDEVLATFADRDIETYWTGVHGDVVLTTDGMGVDVRTDNEFSTDADDLRDERPDAETARIGTPQVDATADRVAS